MKPKKNNAHFCRELYPLNKNIFIHPSEEFNRISNLGNRKGYKLLKRAYNDRYRAELWYGDGGTWFVFVDKKERLEPLPFMYKNTHADFYRKHSSAWLWYLKYCQKFNLTNRETTRHYYKLQEVL